MRPASRVSQAHIRRLYRVFRDGVYDDNILLAVGWGLHARCRDIMTVTRAVRGEVPCPSCGHMVVRPKYAHRLVARRMARGRSQFPCSACGAELAWEDCQQALRDRPQCFACRSDLQVSYTENQLRCPRCDRAWPWRRYRASVASRRRLPCPQCDSLVRCPQPKKYDGSISPGTTGAWWRRRPEHLRCSACGHEFTWAAWRRRHSVISDRTGNLVPVERYLARWPHCGSGDQQFMEIDALLHAMHIRGAMAHLFIEGDEASLRSLLDELAQQR